MARRPGDLTDFERDLLAELPFLQRYANYLCAGHRHRADDVIQDTFLRALTKRRLFIPGTSLQAWLARLMYNCFINQCRSNFRWSSERFKMYTPLLKGDVVSLDES